MPNNRHQARDRYERHISFKGLHFSGIKFPGCLISFLNFAGLKFCCRTEELSFAGIKKSTLFTEINFKSLSKASRIL